MKEWIAKMKLFQNTTLKAASLAGAIIIWLIIMNINDPVITRIIYDVPVNVVNSSVYTGNYLLNACCIEFILPNFFITLRHTLEYFFNQIYGFSRISGI